MLDEILLAHGLIGPSQQCRRTRHVVLSQFQAGKKYLTTDKSVNRTAVLQCQLEALLSALKSSVQ